MWWLRLDGRGLVEDDIGDTRYPRNRASVCTGRNILSHVLHSSHMPDKPVDGDCSIVEHDNVSLLYACVGGS
jgi:hypothetical protein